MTAKDSLKPVLVGLVVGWLTYKAVKSKDSKAFYALVAGAATTLLTKKYLFTEGTSDVTTTSTAVS